MPLLNDLANKTYSSEKLFSDVVHFVHVNVIEPHPLDEPGRKYLYSTVEQPEDYDERVAIAREINTLLEGNQLLLVDDLTPAEHNDPLYCTFGPSPNSAFLIGQEGIIDTSQLWLDVAEMEQAISNLLQ